MLHDIRFGFRLLRKHPAPIAVAIIGLGLAIGVVTTTFSLLNATRLRPYGVHDPHSLVEVTRPSFGSQFRSIWPYTSFLELQSASSLQGVAATLEETARITAEPTDDGAAPRPIAFVSGNYMGLLGGGVRLGRILTPADDQPAAPPVVVISHRLWTTQLAAREDVLGHTLWINRTPATIVGVMQADFSVPAHTQPTAWTTFAAFDDLLKVSTSYTANGRIPLSLVGAAFAPSSRTQVEVIARLRPDVQVVVAEQELTAIANANPAPTVPPAKPAPPVVVKLYSAASPIDGPKAAENWIELLSLLALAGLVLAVACANAANLLLASAASRAREIGVRLAIGATRRRLWMQMTTESLLLGTFASSVGVLIAYWFAPIAASVVALDPGINVAPDLRVLLFGIGVALLCGFVSAVGPARHSAGSNLLAAIQSNGQFGRNARSSSRLRSSFVGTQAAVSMVLLAAAGLLVRTAHVQATNFAGFDVDHVLGATVTTPEVGLDERAYFQRAVDALKATPGVDAVGLIERQPFGHTRELISLVGDSRQFDLYVQRTDASFFSAAGVSLLRGRLYSAAEVAAEAPVAVISDNVAQRYFGSRDPIGLSLSELPMLKPMAVPPTIIGVVVNPILNRPYSEGFGNVFFPLPQVSKGTRSVPPTLVVRSANPSALGETVERVLRSLDAGVRPATFSPREQLDAFTADQRMLASLAWPLAGLALVLAMLGVYGVTAFVVRGRTTEVSIRMALGATNGDVGRLLARDSLRPVLIGLCVGLVLAVAAGQVFASALAGISPHDPVALVGAAVTLGAGAVAAVLSPVRSVARIDPAVVLRRA